MMRAEAVVWVMLGSLLLAVGAQAQTPTPQTSVRASASGQPGPVAAAQPLPVVTLEWALQTSDQNQPNLRIAHANTDAADARVGEARAPLLPQLSGSLSYERTTANASIRPGFIPIGNTLPSPSLKMYNYYQLSVTVSQLIWDFGATLGRYAYAVDAAMSQKDTEYATLLQQHLTVRQAFFQARAQKALLGVAKESFANYEKHTQQIGGFVEVGTRPQIDLAQARTDQANARSQMISAENNYEIGKATLNQAIGVEQTTAYEVAEESMAPLPQEDAPVDQQVQEAFDKRPEIEAQNQVVNADRELISSTRGGYFPAIGASASYSDIGTNPAALTWNWNAQASLSWAIFDGLGTQSRVAEARANVDAAQGQVKALRLSIRLEVETQRWGVRAAKESLVAAKEAEANAKERLTLAEGRYQTGVGSIIELGDSQVAYSTAAAAKVQADYNLASARAALLKALGSK